MWERKGTENSVLFFGAVAMSFAGALPAISQNYSEQEPLVFPDVIACMTANDRLDMRYRNWMQIYCVDVATNICLTVDNRTGECMQTHVTLMRSFYDQLMPTVPTEIDAVPLLARNYQRRVARVQAAFETTAECVT